MQIKLNLRPTQRGTSVMRDVWRCFNQNQGERGKLCFSLYSFGCSIRFDNIISIYCGVGIVYPSWPAAYAARQDPARGDPSFYLQALLLQAGYTKLAINNTRCTARELGPTSKGKCAWLPICWMQVSHICFSIMVTQCNGTGLLSANLV